MTTVIVSVKDVNEARAGMTALPAGSNVDVTYKDGAVSIRTRTRKAGIDAYEFFKLGVPDAKAVLTTGVKFYDLVASIEVA